MIIIDPPVSPYSTVAEIEEWIEDLDTMGSSPEVDRARSQALSWLELKEKHNADNES